MLLKDKTISNKLVITKLKYEVKADKPHKT